MARDTSKEELEIDDGKVVSPMNVEGMPWYRPDRPKSNEGGGSSSPLSAPVKLTAEEKLAFFWGSLKAACLVTLAFFGTFLIVILIILLIGTK